MAKSFLVPKQRSSESCVHNPNHLVFHVVYWFNKAYKQAYIVILPAADDLDSLNKLFPQNIFIEINPNFHSSFPRQPTLRHFEMHISYFNK